jgi:hypothetical protein
MNGKRIVHLSAITIIALTLMSCSSKDGSYFNMLQLPGAILDSVFDNNSSNKKREDVEAYVKQHYDVLKEEIKNQKGEHLDEVMHLAGINPSLYSKMHIQLHKDFKIIFHNTQRITEKLVQNMSRIYEVREKSKKINGFTYGQISEITEKYVNNNFEKIRLAVKNSQSEVFIPLAEELHIKNQKKRDAFTSSLNGKHFELYDDLLVIAIMVGIE